MARSGVAWWPGAQEAEGGFAAAGGVEGPEGAADTAFGVGADVRVGRGVGVEVGRGGEALEQWAGMSAEQLFVADGVRSGPGDGQDVLLLELFHGPRDPGGSLGVAGLAVLGATRVGNDDHAVAAPGGR
ncbi:MAG: hypothetical protein M5U12_27365 [Verrucomicrobia bacterium]|nr:hypothetical protein [Verrucomicrobiota bacterium]